MKDSRSFLLQDGLLYCRGPRGDRLCIPAAGGLRLQVLTELQATPLGGHFGRYKTLALARRSAHWHAQPRRHQLLLPLCLSPAGFSIDAAPPGDPRLRALREGRTLLYWWPAAAGDSDGWQPVQSHASARAAHLARGRLHTADVGAARHRRHTPSLRLDAASCGQRWVLLSPALAAAGRGPGCRHIPDRQPDPPPGHPALTFRLVSGSSQLGPGRAGPGRRLRPFRQQGRNGPSLYCRTR